MGLCDETFPPGGDHKHLSDFFSRHSSSLSLKGAEVHQQADGVDGDHDETGHEDDVESDEASGVDIQTREETGFDNEDSSCCYNKWEPFQSISHKNIFN